ncbi:PREDICTED: 14 kDa phosphohistidine phosphatase [Corvus brachyrhynchos]|uniref:14 kDa phosphohistidine phosphatase n=1 Tax=Corvus brachyrhynchos TaxID=85066 RepID=UPI00081657EE|nr:PREDICTED: 14 kDa phosphohistidine phosphatase [Corvus brachyrhynchos]
MTATLCTDKVPFLNPVNLTLENDHIFEKVNPEMEKLGYECKCLGGGKIEHNSKDKKIRVFGLSTGYGKADHSVTVEILKKEYTDYEITWSDDKK